MARQEFKDKYSAIEKYIHDANLATTLEVSERIKNKQEVNIHPLKLIFGPVAECFKGLLLRKYCQKDFGRFLNGGLRSVNKLMRLSKLWEMNYWQREGKGNYLTALAEELEKTNNETSSTLK